MPHTKISDNRVVPKVALIVDGHSLSYVQSLLPLLTDCGMTIYASNEDPDVFFYVKVGLATDTSGPTYAAFRTTREQVTALLGSTVDIHTFEKNAKSVNFICQPSAVEVMLGSEMDQYSFGQPNFSHDQTFPLVVRSRDEMEAEDPDFDVSDLYADVDAGTYGVLYENCGMIKA